MRDYYEFIFTVAGNTDKMAKVVYDYVTKLEVAMKECDKEISKMGRVNNANQVYGKIVAETKKGAPEAAVTGK